jgi:hypothetical protein
VEAMGGARLYSDFIALDRNSSAADMLTGQARIKEIMREPISRQEAMAMEDRVLMNVASCAAGLEALEKLLIEKNILKDDDLMTAVKALLEKKTEQAKAADATKSIIEVT